MSSEALTKTLGVLSNLTEKIQYFNTSQEEAKELITVRNCQDFLYSRGYSGCKENHFYSLPFGQAEANIY